MPALATPEAATPPTDAFDLGCRLRTPKSTLWRDPRVLDAGWSAPTLLGREEVLEDLRERVLPQLAPGKTVAVSVHGPRGAGTSSVARWLVDSAGTSMARGGPKGSSLLLHPDASSGPKAPFGRVGPRTSACPLVLRVDASAHRSPSSLVTALFREIDPSYDGRGASAEFGLLLLLRRIRTVGRPAIIFLDQVGPRADLSRVLRPLARPDRLLPEGPAGLPTMLVVAAGQRDPFPEDVEAVRARLTPLDHADLCRAIAARASLAFAGPASSGSPTRTGLPQEPCPGLPVSMPRSGSFGQHPPISSEAVDAIARLSIAQGWGLSMVAALLREAGRRAEARGGRWLEAEDVALPATLPRHGANAEGFGQAILEVLRDASGSLTAGELRRRVAEECASSGMRAPTQARLWRHLVALGARSATPFRA